jgi:cation:H+ antiporter
MHMELFGHFVAGHIALTAIWLSAGALIRAVKNLAATFHKSSFVVSFLVLGTLTSLSEISVALNSTALEVPQVSAGNLVGASFVLLLFVVPLLAALGNGIRLKKTFSRGNVILALLTIALPALFVMDGSVSWGEGIAAIFAYGAFLVSMLREQPEKPAHTPRRRGALVFDILKVIIGAVVIFIAGRMLVSEVIYFGGILHVPNSLIALIVLSIGTNIPELTIAARAVVSKETDIAFGDYIGSAAVNTLIFGFLGLANHGFLIESSVFTGTAILTVCGFGLLYVFATSKQTISRREGMILLLFYAAFIIFQTANIVTLSSR